MSLPSRHAPVAESHNLLTQLVMWVGRASMCMGEWGDGWVSVKVPGCMGGLVGWGLVETNARAERKPLEVPPTSSHIGML
jgi:hypothetical protein